MDALRDDPPSVTASATPRVWLLKGPKLGDYTQIRALAAAVGWPTETKTLAFHGAELLLHLLDVPTRLGLVRRKSDELVPPWPDVVLTAGRRNELVARWIKRCSGGRARLVHVGRPWSKPGTFDLVVTTPQYRLAPGPGIVTNELPLHDVTAGSLDRARDEWQSVLGMQRRPRLAVLVGGDSGPFVFTAALARELEQRLGPRTAVVIIPDGARLAPDRTFDWQGPATPPVVAYAGHLYPWKGVETLLGALAAVPALRGRIIGGHPAEPDLARLQRFAATLGLGDRIEFLGMRPPGEIAGHLRASDLLVLPNRATSVSASYTSPLKLFEYLAAGRPIVASDLPALREILRDRENAWLVPADDPAALGAALETIARDRPLALRLARAGFDTAAAFSWDRRAERIERVVEESKNPGAVV